MEHLLNIVADNFLTATIGGCILAGMIVKSVTAIITTSSRERSRREIAAYIAEGSMTPDQGERLIRADVNCQSRNRAA